MTLAALTDDVRAHLEGDYRPRLEVLDTALDTDDDSVALSYNGVLTPGAILSVDLEDFYVLDWEQGTRTAIVIRGHRGTTPAAHDDGAVVEVNPRFSAGQIYRALRDELRGWGQELYQTVGAAVSVAANAAVAELPEEFSGLYGIVEATVVDYYRAGTGQPDTGTVSHVLYREPSISGIIRDFATLGFTYELVRFNTITPYACTVHMMAGLPFGELATDSTTLLNQGILPYMEEALVLGAAAKLLRPREAARTQRSAQGEPRRGEEVPPMHTRNAGADLGLLAKEAYGRAVRRLRSSYPLRFT